MTHCVQPVVGAVLGGITAVAGPVAAILTWLAVTYSYRMIKLRVVTEVQNYLKVEDICDPTDFGHAYAPGVSQSQSGAIQMSMYTSGNFTIHTVTCHKGINCSCSQPLMSRYIELFGLPT